MNRLARAGGPKTSRYGRWLVLVLPPLGLAAASAHQLIYNGGGAVDWALAQATVWPLLLRRRAPVAVFGAVLLVCAVCWALHLLLLGQFAVLIALYQVAAQRSAVHAVAPALLAEVGAVVVAFRFSPASSVNDAVIILSAFTVSFLFLGTTRHAQARYLDALEERTEHLERERSQRAAIAAAAERARIARELHDIVAHSVSVMITLAEGAAARSLSDPPGAHDVMREVASTGREALVELRTVVSVLRDGTSDTRAPQPTLATLDDLVSDFRRSGVPVDLRVSGDLAALPGSLQATAYRIVQESLTNILKHAADATEVSIEVRRDSDTVHVRVHDDGRCGSSSAGGNGIRGMRERAALYGGELAAGPDRAGWAVSCSLPAARGKR